MRVTRKASDLPDGWRWATISELAAPEPNSITDGPFGSKLKTEHYTESGPRVIRLQNIGDSVFVDAQAHISDEHFGSLLKHRVFAGDLVIAALGENPPRSCIIPESVGPAIVKADCIRLKPRTDVSAKFINYAINSEETRRRTKTIVHGVGRPRLNLTEIKSIAIPLPPLEQQQHIVAEIEKQFTRLEAGVASLKRVQTTMKRYRDSVLNDAAKVSWPSIMISEISEVVTGSTPSKEKPGNYGGDLPFIKPADLNAGYRVHGAKEHLSPAGARMARILPANTVLVTCIGATIGKSGLARVPCATNQQINAVIPHDHIVLAEWVYWMLSSPFGQEQIKANASATTLPILNKRRFEMVTLPVPPLAEQAAIVADIERRLSMTEASDRTVHDSLRRAARLRQSILHAAFSGEL